MSIEEIRIEVAQAIKIYEDLIGHDASRTHQMIEDHGEIDALSRLMNTPDLQKGFKALRDRGRLDQSFEAIIARYPDEFEDNTVQIAQWRLDNADELPEPERR